MNLMKSVLNFLKGVKMVLLNMDKVVVVLLCFVLLIVLLVGGSFVIFIEGVINLFMNILGWIVVFGVDFIGVLIFVVLGFLVW